MKLEKEKNGFYSAKENFLRLSYCKEKKRKTRAEKMSFSLVATLEPSLKYLVVKLDNLVAKSTIDNIHIMIPGGILGCQIGNQD